MILWLNTENRANKISQIMRVQLQHVCMLVISRVNIPHLNTSLNDRSTLHCTTLNYIAQLSFISDFIPALLSSFASFLFLLCDLNHNFDKTPMHWTQSLLYVYKLLPTALRLFLFIFCFQVNNMLYCNKSVVC